MAIVQQMWDSADYEFNISDSSGSSAVVYYLVYGVKSESEAVSEVLAQVDDEYEGMQRTSISVQERLTETEWKVQVNYGSKSNGSGTVSDDTTEPDFNFEISTETRKIVRSIKQVDKLPANAPDSVGINDGEGIDVVCPVSTFTETVFLRPSLVTTTWKKKIMKMVGTMNSGEFRGFNGGELLFLGCSGTRHGDSSKDLWQVSFRFAFKANEENIQLGKLTFPFKRGWDVLWVRFKEKTVENDGYRQILRTPVAAYIERVYHVSNYRELGI